MIIDGKAIAEEMYAELQKQRVALAQRSLGEVGLRLGIIVAKHDPVIESFVRIKSKVAERLGIEMRRVDLLRKPTTTDAVAVIERLVPQVDGIIVQLPLPDTLDTDRVLSAIPPYLDVDGINPAVSNDEKIVFPPVASAVEHILKYSNTETAGKRCVVVGRGRLVGAPVAHLLRELGGDVETITLEEGALDVLHDADVIVLGAGSPHLVKPEMIKEGVVLIDAGTSESAGKVVGDADPACAQKASIFTPVPGGVGPIAVAMLFENLFTLIENNTPDRETKGVYN